MITTNRTRLVLAALLLTVSSPALPMPAAVPDQGKPDHEIWVIDQIIYRTPKDPIIIGEIMKTHSIDAIIAVLESHQIQFQRQSNRLDTATLPAKLYEQISALPPGEPFVVPDGDRSVANAIVGHESDSSTGELVEAARRNNWTAL